MISNSPQKYFGNFFLLVFLILIFAQSVFALSANSSSYSVSMFGTGMATADSNSDNYSSTFLSEARGTTRNAETSLLTGNIGFFGNTSYYRVVSITSYEIYPESAVQGSIIRMSVSALNSEAVWAVLTLPDSSEETLSLTNDEYYYYTANSVGTYTVTFYANSSQRSLASVIDTFEITSSTPPSSSSSSGGSSSGSGGGGGGTTTVIEKCTYIWDCTSWSICVDGKQYRECENIGNCTGTEGKPIEERICSDALFDVTIGFSDLIITENNTLKFNVSLVEQKGIEKIDVQISYSIIDEDNQEIFNQLETRAIQGELNYEKELKEVQLGDGDYILRVDILYGDLQRAFAEQKFEVKKGELEVPSEGLFIKILLIFFAILIIILLSIIFILLKRRKKKKKRSSHIGRISRNLKRIKSRRFAILFFSSFVFAFLLTAGKSMTGFVVGNVQDNTGIFSFVFVVGVLVLFGLVYRKKLFEKIKVTIENKKECPTNSAKGLIGKRVYTEEGDYVGGIKDILLKENKIDSLKIKLAKKIKIGIKGILIKYKHVQSVGKIVIIDNIVRHLENYKNKEHLDKVNKEEKNEK